MIPEMLTRFQIEHRMVSEIAQHHGIKVLDFYSIWISDGRKLTYETYVDWYLSTYTPLGRALK